MPIEQLLAKLGELAQRAAAGQDVSVERAQVEGQLRELGFVPASGSASTPAAPAASAATATLTAPAAPAATAFGGNGALSTDDASELARLRQAEQTRQLEGVASTLATMVQTTHAQAQNQQADLLSQALGRELAQRGLVVAPNGQDPVIASAVHQVLKGTQQGSRFAGANANDDVLRHVANGGTIGQDGQLQYGAGVPGGVQAGQDRELEEINNSKSLGLLMSIVARAHKSPYMLKPAEQRFMQNMAEKAMAQGTDTAGGFLVPPEWMEDILPLIRAQAVVRRANPRIVPFNKLMQQTSVSTGTTAYYTQENARIPVSEMTFAEAPILTPKYLTALVPVSNYLLNNAEGVNAMVRDDMVAALTTREDLAFIQGTGAGGEPKGLRNLSGVILNPLNPGTNGFAPTLPDFRRIRGRTRLLGSPNPRWTWFFHPALLTYLETLTDTTGRVLVDAGIMTINEDGVSGRFDGLPFFCSYQIPTTLSIGASSNATYILLVNMNDTIIGESQSLSIDVSSEATYSPDGGTTHVSAFQQNQTVFRIIIGHDINHRRPSLGVIDQEGVLV